MKVIQILPELNSGGVELCTLETGKYLAEQGHDSLVISNGGRLVEQLEREGSRHIQLPVHRKNLLSLRQLSALRQIFAEMKPDVLHVHSRVPAWLTWLVWRKMPPASRPRLVTTVHGFNSVNRYSEIMTRGERVITVSKSICEFVRQNYPDVRNERLCVIHGGIDPQEYNYGFQPSAEWLRDWQKAFPNLENRIVLTLPGRLTRLKGHEDFLKIVAALRARNVPVHGLIVGDTHPRKQSYRLELEAKVEEGGLGDAITFTGQRSDIREILSVSNVVLSLNNSPEAFGRTTLEALSLGVPVIGYNFGGVGEQLDCLFPEGSVCPGDREAVVRLIESWGQNPCRPNRENPFILDVMLERTLSVYRELVSDVPPNG